MVAVVALAKQEALPVDEIGATFVVPAPRGCDLACPFCFIRMRGEAGQAERQLSERNYLEFLEQLNRQCRIGLVSLQGYEALLPESWPYSEALLERAKEMGIETMLVTNGTHLVNRVPDLLQLGVRRVTVSLDSADAATHDRLRGTPGAFAATLEGLKAACASELKDRLVVASVLQRDKPQYLRAMPQLLNELGLKQWMVSPLYNVRRGTRGSVADSPENIRFQLTRLKDMAGEYGVQLVEEGDYGFLGAQSAGPEQAKRKQPGFGQLVRLSPNGSFSIGREILRRADSDVAVWRPDTEPAGAFVSRMVEWRLSQYRPEPDFVCSGLRTDRGPLSGADAGRQTGTA